MRLLGQPPARLGMSLVEVDTPALLLDLDAFDRNLRRLAGSVAGGSVRLRPHAKTHKCPEIARRQIAAGAVGVCCQKVSEAEAMVAGGILDLHLSNEVVGAAKLACLVELSLQAKVSVCVDDAHNVADLDAAAARCGTTLAAYVEINAGSNRCGVPSPAAALGLAQHVIRCSHLRFAGLQVYDGPAQHLRSFRERGAASAAAAGLAQETKALLAKHGIHCPAITGGGTGTLPFDVANGVFDEIQPGSYIFMDVDYARNESPNGSLAFEQSLFVWTTLMSHPAAHYGAVDAGLKAVSLDSGPPSFQGQIGIEYSRGTDEHGVVRFTNSNGALRVGDKLMLVPGHCDPTVNLHEWIVGVRAGHVEVLWPITARGAFR